jgi:hypothetical protein
MTTAVINTGQTSLSVGRGVALAAIRKRLRDSSIYYLQLSESPELPIVVSFGLVVSSAAAEKCHLHFGLPSCKSVALCASVGQISA